jgi:hypothetical protein
MPRGLGDHLEIYEILAPLGAADCGSALELAQHLRAQPDSHDNAEAAHQSRRSEAPRCL